MARLTLEQLLAAPVERASEEVPVPELGGDLLLTALSANDRIDWERAAFPEGVADTKEYLMGLVARCVVGDAIDQLPAITAKVGTFSTSTIQALHDVASRLNGVGAKEVADTEGKSGETPVSDPASPSPSDSDTLTPG